MEKTRSFDLLDKQQDKSSALLVTLLGIKQTLAHHLGLSTVAFTMREDNHAVLRRQPETERFPYGWFFVNNFTLTSDRQALKTLSRHAMGLTVDEATNTLVQKAYMFPAELTLEFHFVSNDILDVIKVIEKVAIISGIDKFSFESSVDGFQWMTSLNLQDNSTSIPRSIVEDPALPNAFDISFAFKAVTKVGVTKDVPKINNEGAVTQTVNTK